MRIDARIAIGRRRDQQARLIEHAERFAAQLDQSLDVRAVVVFGSVARGDFNVWSDVDVLVVAESLPDGQLDRLRCLGPGQPLVQAVAWTEAELCGNLGRSNPIAVEARERGIWLRGTADLLAPG